MGNDTTDTSRDPTSATGMALTYAGPFAFEGRGRAPASCYLRIWRGRGHLPVIIASELPDNAGSSISQVAALVATQVWQRLMPSEREGFIWIERYPKRPAPPHRQDDPRFGERLELVEFTPLGQDVMYLGTQQERRRTVSRSTVEQLIGGVLPMAPDEV